MPKVVSVVGSSGSGKTTFVESIVPLLREHGLRVGTVKHASHGASVDREGSDSRRHFRAGASPVVLVAPDETVVFTPASGEGLSDVVKRYMTDVDLVLAEGFTDSPVPKVLVHRSGREHKELPEGSDVLFVLTDEPLGYETELAHDDLGRALELLVDYCKRPGQKARKIAVKVDGREVILTDFVATFVAETIRGMLSALKGVPRDPSAIEVRIESD